MKKMESTGKYIKRKIEDIGSVLYRNVGFSFVKIGLERKYDSIIGKGAYFNKGTKLEGKDYIGNGVVLANVYVGFSSYIGPFARISNTKIGKYTCVGDLETVAGRHPVKGENIAIHPALYSTKRQFGYTYVNKDYFEEVRSADKDNGYNILIGNDVWIGWGVMITDGVTIGDGAVIGARSLVTTDVEPYAIYAGTPAKKIGMRFDDDTVDKLLKLRWWDKGEDWIKEHAEEFADPKSFINKAIDA